VEEKCSDLHLPQEVEDGRPEGGRGLRGLWGVQLGFGLDAGRPFDLALARRPRGSAS